MLKTTKQVIEYISQRYAEVEEHMKPYYKIIYSTANTAERISQLETDMSVDLPDSYKRFIAEYDLSTFSIYAFRFNPYSILGSDLVQSLVEANQPGYSPHSQLIKSTNMLIIGAYDQDDILLDLALGEMHLLITDSGEIVKLANSVEQLVLIVTNIEFINSTEADLLARQYKFVELLKEFKLEINKAWEMFVQVDLTIEH